MSDKIELGKLCGVLQSKFLCLSQSESRTQPCHVRIDVNHGKCTLFISTISSPLKLFSSSTVEFVELSSFSS